MPDEPTDNLVIEAVPSDRLWFDPMCLNANNNILITDIPFISTVTKQAAPANAGRWAIGFFSIGLFTGWACSPWPDLEHGTLFTASASSPNLWANLFTYGPLVSNSWWVKTSGSFSIRIVQIIRN